MRILLILIPIILLSILVSGGLGIRSINNSSQASPLPVSSATTSSDNPSSSGGKNLQLSTIKLASPSPNSPVSSNSPVSPNPPVSSSTHVCDPNSEVAVDLLLDVSSSMSGDRIGELNQAVNIFAGSLQDGDVVGIQFFSSTPYSYMPLALYRVNRSLFPINLGAYGNTAMKDAFLFAKSSIDAARPNFPNHAWVLIFLSDGVPTDPTFGEGPYEPQNPSSVASEIKASGVRIFSIGLGLDSLVPPSNIQYAKSLLPPLASQPGDFKESPSASDLTAIYQSIRQSICR